MTQRRSLRKAFLSLDTLIIIYLHKIKWRIFYEHQPTCADNQRYSQAPINLISFNVGDGFFSIWTVEQFSKISWWVWVRYFGMSSSCTRDNKSDRVPRTDQSTAPAPVLRDHLFTNQQLNCCSRVTASRIRYGQLGQIWRHYCNFLLKCSLFNLEQIDTRISRPTSWDEACDWQCLDNKS